MSSQTTYLRRYTDLTSLLHILSKKKITLLDPMSWDDRNDAYFMEQYKERKKLKSLLALCFSKSAETYHHWHVFAKGPSGICIEFNRKLLLADLGKVNGVRCESIEYLKLAEARDANLEADVLPFIKRAGYEPEGEFRVIYESKTEKLPAFDIPFNPSCINKITLSPWLNEALKDSVQQAIQCVKDFDKVRVIRSTLISNEAWKRCADEM